MAAPANSPGARGAAPDSERPSAGFDVRLPTAQLADLIQINCLNRVRGAFRVSSGRDEGHLFFDAGQLVHADFGEAVGLDAVVMMLGLRGGSVEPCARPWPTISTIDMGADALLLNAAQRLDEAGERRSDPGRDATTKVVRRAPLDWGNDEGEFVDAHDAETRPSLPPSEDLSRLAVAQVGLDGKIQRLRAGASGELADTAFYTQQVAGLIGAALGLGECRALLLQGPEEGIVVFRGRGIVGVRGKLDELGFVRTKVGLD
jgi:hypothetical protein